MGERPPSVERVRPKICAHCGLASHPLGHRIRVVGHGSRIRRVMGVLDPKAGTPKVVIVDCRRYRCLDCGCTMLVVPSEISRAYHYSLITIVLVLGQLAEMSLSALRHKYGVGTTFDEGWVTVGRWIRAVPSKLFRFIRGLSELTGRQRGQRIADVLAARAGISSPDASFLERVLAGGLIA